jgi:hypothetical protein
MFRWIKRCFPQKLEKSGGLQEKLKALEMTESVAEKILRREDRRRELIPELSLHRRQEDLAS